MEYANWKPSIDNLTAPQLQNKRKDIVACLETARTPDAKNKYEEQLSYIDAVIGSVEQIAVVFKNAPDNRLTRIEDEPE